MLTGSPRSFTFVFVCQAGPLEIKAMLLAASLRKFLRCPFELVAAIPAPAARWGTPSEKTLAFLDELGVRTVSITNAIDAEYPIGNKVSCLGIATSMDRLVFVDSDILLIQPFMNHARFDVSFAAKPADMPALARPRHWRRAYLAAGTRLPPARVATSLYGEFTHLYFNAGFIVVDPTARLGAAWLDCCQRIDARWGITCKRPHLDQLALPVAVSKLGLSYVCLDESYNFPAHLKPIDESDPPLLAHYHDAAVLRREPLLRRRVGELCREYPALVEGLRAEPDYAALAPAANGSEGVRPRETEAPNTAELILTGIPRSGTSFLCNLLHRHTNCVVFNEPDQVSKSLRKQPIPYRVGTFFRDMRREILEGRPVRNKLRDGIVTDETMGANEQSEYRPRVIDEQFVVGVKNPLGFLSRLDALRTAMPGARVVACVRNPFDTIASWKTAFAHLRSADVARMNAGGLLDCFLSVRQRQELREVAEIRSTAWRRAAWWRYLANLILEAGPSVIVVRYQSLVSQPLETIGPIVQGFVPGEPSEPIEPSSPRTQKRSALDEEDIQAIRALCSAPARSLGVCDVWNESDRPLARAAGEAVAVASDFAAG